MKEVHTMADPENSAAEPFRESKDHERIRTDSLLRETSTNFIRLIGDADRKARIMLIVNSIFLTISVTLLTKSILDTPYLWISATILMLSNVLTLFFSIQSVKPEFKRKGEKESEANIIHYKKCHQLTLEEYSSEIRDTMHDNEKKMDAIIKDLYRYGNLLNMKYKFLHIAYSLFSWGVSMAVISYMIIVLLINK